jgi:hypothetical protein
MIRTIYPASDFRVPFVNALAGLRGRVLRERGIGAIKIAPMSGAATTNSPKRCNGSRRLRQPIRAVAVGSSMGGPAAIRIAVAVRPGGDNNPMPATEPRLAAFPLACPRPKMAANRPQVAVLS